MARHNKRNSATKSVCDWLDQHQQSTSRLNIKKYQILCLLVIRSQISVGTQPLCWTIGMTRCYVLPRLVSSVQALMASSAGYIIASSCDDIIEDG